MKTTLLATMIMLSSFAYCSVNTSQSFQTNYFIFPEDSIQIVAVTNRFYEWYLQAIENYQDHIITSPEVIQDANGKCLLNLEPYFQELREVSVFSEKFIAHEVERTQSCADFLADLNWSEYEMSEAYTYQDHCPFFYYHYWIRSQETFDGVEVHSIESIEDYFFVTLTFYNESNDGHILIDYYQPIIQVEKENDKWLITQIRWNNE